MKKLLKKITRIAFFRIIKMLLVRILFIVPLFIIGFDIIRAVLVGPLEFSAAAVISTIVIMVTGFFLPFYYGAIDSWEKLTRIIINSSRIKRNASPFQRKIIKFYLYYMHFHDKELMERYDEYLLSKPFYIKKNKVIILLSKKDSFRRRWFRHAYVAISERWFISAIENCKIAILGNKMRFYSRLY